MSSKKLTEKWNRWLLISLSFIMLFFLGGCVEEPGIAIDGVSAYGDPSGHVWGHVSVVNPDEWLVMGFIEVEEVWWTKPYYSQPLTSINPDGTWDIDITTGGIDQCATRVMVFLVPVGAPDPYICDPCFEVPTPPEAVASDMVDRMPPERIISFAGREWKVKRSDCPVGPGPNYFSDSEESVWVDENGFLHLTIENQDGKWNSTEVILTISLGYGVYIFHTESQVDILDPNMVLGLFTYETAAYEQHHRELDIEYARWSNPEEYTNSQFVVQPCSECPGCSNCSRFRVDLTEQDKSLTNMFIWSPGRVEFRVYKGKYYDDFPGNMLVHQWVKEEGVPDAGNENVRMNFWLFQGEPPANGLGNEVVVSDFVWLEDLQEEPGIAIDGVSPYGDPDGYVWGHVVGIDPQNYSVAVYINARGGWWTKPYWDEPLTPINSDFTWDCDITTGGVDEEATEICAFLVPNDYAPPSMSGQSDLPLELFQFPNDCVTRTAP